MDLDIEEGEFVAIVGPSGGGKTTLMNILGLLDGMTEGEYLLDGEAVHSIGRRRLAALRARKIGFVFQAFHLLEARPAIDSVELNMLYRGVARSLRLAKAQHAIDAVGLGDRATQTTSRLSGGQRQRLAIARAIAAEAKLILADEPTGNLDSRTASRILDELDRLNREGATIVVVTHSDEVAARAHRVVSIADGRLVADTRREVRSSSSAASEPQYAQPGTDEVHGLERVSERPVQTSESRDRMRIADMLRDAWVSVLSRPFQTLGQCFAVAIAVALAVTTLGLSSSARAQVSATFDAHLNREVSAKWSSSVPHSPPVSSIPGVVKKLRGVDAVAAVIDMSPATVSTFAEARQVRPHIAIGDIIGAARLSVREAAWHHGPLASDEVFVGDLLANQLQLGALESAPSITIGNTSYVVAGLIRESSRLPLLRGEVVVGAPSVDPTIAGASDVNVYVVTAAGAAPQVARQLASALNPYQPDQISIVAPTDSKQLRGQVEQGVQATLTAFTILALVIAIAALANATLLAVNARRSEIGMRKALGARDVTIGTLITTESAYVGVLGGVAGLLLGMATILVVTLSQRWAPVFDIWLMPIAIIIGLLVGGGGGGLASFRAARLRPAENLRS